LPAFQGPKDRSRRTAAANTADTLVYSIRFNRAEIVRDAFSIRFIFVLERTNKNCVPSGEMSAGMSLPPAASVRGNSRNSHERKLPDSYTGPKRDSRKSPKQNVASKILAFVSLFAVLIPVSECQSALEYSAKGRARGKIIIRVID
jgi:hypothetical protein